MQECKGKFYLPMPAPPTFCYFRIKQTCTFIHNSALATEFNEIMHVKVLSKLIFVQSWPSAGSCYWHWRGWPTPPPCILTPTIQQVGNQS